MVCQLRYLPAIPETVDHRFTSKHSVVETRRVLFEETIPWLADAGYRLESQEGEGVVVNRRYLPEWAFWVGLLTVPLVVGIFILIFFRSDERITFSLFPVERGTEVVITGQATAEVASGLQRIRGSAEISPLQRIRESADGA